MRIFCRPCGVLIAQAASNTRNFTLFCSFKLNRHLYLWFVLRMVWLVWEVFFWSFAVFALSCVLFAVPVVCSVSTSWKEFSIYPFGMDVPLSLNGFRSSSLATAKNTVGGGVVRSHRYFLAFLDYTYCQTGPKLRSNKSKFSFHTFCFYRKESQNSRLFFGMTL